MTFIACIVMNPDAQRKGQEEIDRVVGNSRLPDFTDRDSLPYVECIVQEVQRYATPELSCWCGCILMSRACLQVAPGCAAGPSSQNDD